MSALEIRIELEDRLSGALAKAAARAEDLTTPMGLIAEQLLISTDRRFDTETDPLGVPWVKRRDENNPKPLLHQDGYLRGGLTQNHGRDFAEVGVEETGGPAVYAAVHQLGATIKPKAGSGKKALKTPFGPRASVTIPARPFLGFSDGDRDEVGDILTAHFADLLDDEAAT